VVANPYGLAFMESFWIGSEQKTGEAPANQSVASYESYDNRLII